MSALVAMRFNADMKAKYNQLIAGGKAPKEAITALMRQIVILANALIKKTAIGTKKWLDQNGQSKCTITKA